MTKENSTFIQIRRTLEFHHQASSKNDDRYRLDRNYMSQYFDAHKKWKEKIIAYFREIKKKKESIVCVDICGRTTGRTMGADETYCFALRTSEFTKKISGDDRTFFNGDLFNTNDFNSFIYLVKQGKVAPALITFEPVAGLQDYGPFQKCEGAPLYKEITYQQLTKRLYKAIEMLKPGGYLYMERPFQFDESSIDFLMRKPKNQFQISLYLKKIARKMKCTIEIGDSLGIYFLLRKSEKSARKKPSRPR